MKKVLLSLSGLLIAFQITNAQIKYDFNSGSTSGTSSDVDYQAGPVTVGNGNGTVSNLNNVNPSYVNNGTPNTGYTGASGGNYIQATARDGGVTAASTYYEFTITPQNNKSISTTAFSFGKKALTANGPQNYVITTSLQNFSTTTTSSSDPATGPITTGWRNTNVKSLNAVGPAGVPVTYRIYGFNGSGEAVNTAQWALDDIIIYFAFPPTTTLNANDGTLPIKLASFSAKSLDKSVLLSWTTASELNNAKFNILHSSNGKNFTKIGEVLGAGTSTKSLSYSFTDFKAEGGSNYYILEQVDLNGESTQTQPVVSKLLSSSVSNNLLVFASSNSVTATIQSSYIGTASINLFDMSGKQLAKQSLNLTKGINSITFDITLSPGIYVAKMLSNGQSTSVKFVKK